MQEQNAHSILRCRCFSRRSSSALPRDATLGLPRRRRQPLADFHHCGCCFADSPSPPTHLKQNNLGSSTSVCTYDVYCFGEVLLELVTGKLGISASSEGEFEEWLGQILPCIGMYDKELVTKIVDPSLVVDEDFLEEVWAIAIIARSCLNSKRSR